MSMDKVEKQAKAQLEQTIESCNHKKGALEALKASIGSVNHKIEVMLKDKETIERTYEEMQGALASLQESQTAAEKNLRHTESSLKEQIKRIVREKVDLDMNISKAEVVKKKDADLKKIGFAQKSV